MASLCFFFCYFFLFLFPIPQNKNYIHSMHILKHMTMKYLYFVNVNNNDILAKASGVNNEQKVLNTYFKHIQTIIYMCVYILCL